MNQTNSFPSHTDVQSDGPIHPLSGVQLRQPLPPSTNRNTKFLPAVCDAVKKVRSIFASTNDHKTTKKANSISKGRMLWTRAIAGMNVLLAVAALAVSMPHLKDGAEAITKCTSMTAWLLAILFDLIQLVMEAALLNARFVHLEIKARSIAIIMVAWCTCISITLNIRAFLQHCQSSFDTIMAVLWGLTLPLAVLGLFAVASVLLTSNNQFKR